MVGRLARCSAGCGPSPSSLATRRFAGAASASRSSAPPSTASGSRSSSTRTPRAGRAQRAAGVRDAAALRPALAADGHVRRSRPAGANARGRLSRAGGHDGAARGALLVDAAPIVVYAFAVLSAPTFNLTRPTLNVVMPLAVRSTRRAHGGQRGDGMDRERGCRHRTAHGLAARRPRGRGHRGRALRRAHAARDHPLAAADEKPAAGRAVEPGVARCRMPPRCSACSGASPGPPHSWAS